jgi:hypothetical protein
MKKIRIGIFAGLVMFGAMASWASAQKATAINYKAQLEAALGGKIIVVQTNPHYPVGSLTQAVNLTVSREGGRTDIVPVQIVFVKASGGYAVQSMYVLNTSPAMAAQRATQLPTPSAETMGGGGGTGTGTGTSSRPSSSSTDCRTKCFTNPTGGPIDWVKASACYLACLLGLPSPLK